MSNDQSPNAPHPDYDVLVRVDHWRTRMRRAFELLDAKRCVDQLLSDNIFRATGKRPGAPSEE